MIHHSESLFNIELLGLFERIDLREKKNIFSFPPQGFLSVSQSVLILLCIFNVIYLGKNRLILVPLLSVLSIFIDP